LYGPSLTGSKILLPLNILTVPGFYSPRTSEPGRSPSSIGNYWTWFSVWSPVATILGRNCGLADSLRGTPISTPALRTSGRRFLRSGCFARFSRHRSQSPGLRFSRRWSAVRAHTCFVGAPFPSLLAGNYRSLGISPDRLFRSLARFPGCATRGVVALAAIGGLSSRASERLGRTRWPRNSHLPHLGIGSIGCCCRGAAVFRILWPLVYLRPVSQAWFSRSGLLTAATLVAAWLLGFLLAAPAILPLVEYSRTGARLERRGAGGEERPPVGASALPQVVLPRYTAHWRPGALPLLHGDRETPWKALLPPTLD